MYVNTGEMLEKARREHYLVIGASCWSLNSASTFIDAATELNMPLILMLWEGAPEPIAGQERICDYVRCAAGKTHVPIALHLDHAHSVKTVYRAIHAGFSSIMLDSSELPFAENVEATQEIVKVAHACGVTVEAELGHVGGSSCEIMGNDAVQGNLTVPEEAAEFVRLTGVDSLAVSVGTIHGAYRGEPRLDFERLKRIYLLVDIPLVLHGGSGTGIELLKKSAQYGVSKLNIMTDLIKVARRAASPESMLPEIFICDAISECLKNYMLPLTKPL